MFNEPIRTFEEPKKRGSVLRVAWMAIAACCVVIFLIGGLGEILKLRDQQHQDRSDLQSIVIPESTDVNYRTILAPAGLSLYEIDMPNGDVCRIVRRASKAASRSFDPAIHCKQE